MARPHMRAHICNVQNKHFLYFVTSLLAVQFMKQTSRIIELGRTCYRCVRTQRQKAKQSRSERISVIVNAEISTVKFDESMDYRAGQFLLRFGWTVASLQSCCVRSRNW